MGRALLTVVHARGQLAQSRLDGVLETHVDDDGLWGILSRPELSASHEIHRSPEATDDLSWSDRRDPAEGGPRCPG